MAKVVENRALPVNFDDVGMPRGVALSAGDVLESIQADERYQGNLDYGKPRPGHPEGTVRNHISELERNLKVVVLTLDEMGIPLSEEQVNRLKVLIHSHDTFKKQASRGVAIDDPNSHASLAAAVVQEYGADQALFQAVQEHDRPYSMWKKHDETKRGKRFDAFQETVINMNEFALFQIIDNVTEGKDLRPVTWFVHKAAGLVSPELDLKRVLREVAAVVKPEDARDPGRELGGSLSNEISSDIWGRIQPEERAAAQEFLRHLAGYCRNGMEGFSMQAKFDLPRGWQRGVREVLLEAAPETKTELSGDEQTALRELGGQVDLSQVDPTNFDVRQSGLVRDMLDQGEKDYKRILLQSVSFVGSDLPEQAKVTLGKIVSSIGEVANRSQLDPAVGTALLLSVSGGITKFVEDNV